MKTKETLFLSKTAQGTYSVQALFGSSGIFEKTAGAEPFSDWETGEALRKFLRTITSKDRKQNLYVLVNALGAGEFFGSNINGDYFPWDSLSHQGKDFGYLSFLDGHAFSHHANKDPDRAFGVPVLSVLNNMMKRVELVIKLDREKAEAEGAGSVIIRIEKGEFPDVSMGAKVPYDICSICGHKSKTREDYCPHLRPPPEMRGIWGINRILSDGRKIYMINDRPRFFDISFVFIGADKTAKVMAKLASKGSKVCLGNVCAVPCGANQSEVEDGPELFNFRGEKLVLAKTAEAEGMRGPCGKLCSSCPEEKSCHEAKLASAFGAKTAAQSKRATIVKQVPGGEFSTRTLPRLEGREQDISREDLDALSVHPLPRVLGAASMSGMVLKPHEFQHLVLRRMGEDDLLSKLEQGNQVFRQGSAIREERPIGDADPLDTVFDTLKKYIKSRTALGHPFQIRVLIASADAKNTLPTREAVEHPLLDKISAAYNAYRRDLMSKLSQAVDAVQSDPELREEVLGDELSNMFTKTSSSQLITLDSVAYFLGAHLEDRGLLNESTSQLKDEWILGEDHSLA